MRVPNLLILARNCRFLVLFVLTSLGGLVTLPAQTIDGLWNYTGFWFEQHGGITNSSATDPESGTFTFTPLGDDRYGVVVAGDDPENFELVITQSGNTFTTVAPSDPEPNQAVANLTKITVFDDFALLVSVDSSVSTETGLVGQSFNFSTSVYLLSRGAIPAQQDSLWEGEYLFRLNGIQFKAGEPGFTNDVEVPSISLNRVTGGVNGVVADFIGPAYELMDDAVGVKGIINSSVDGAYDDVVMRDHFDRVVWAIQIDDQRVAWLQSTALIGTVNTGTPDEYFVIAEGGASAGLAQRVATAPPSFVRQPSSVSVLAEGDAFLSAEATGAPAPSYAWEISNDGGTSWDSLVNFDEASFGGAETSTLVVRAGAGFDGNQFRVRATNSQGSVTSDAAILTVLPEPTTRLPNLSVRTTLDAAQNLIVGFVMTGGSKPLLLRAIGPQLGEFGVTGVMPNPRIGFFDQSGAEIDSNDDWLAADAPLFDELGAFALNAESKDAALRVSLSGASTASVSGPEGGTVLVEVYDVGDSNETRLSNVSARNWVGTDSDVLIAGFVVTGEDPKNILVRAIGPGLRQFGLTGVLNDPKVEIFSGSTVIASNDNWGAGLRPSFETTGAFDLPDNSLDSAMVITLPPGAYTVQLSGADGGTGEALAEIYELP